MIGSFDKLGRLVATALAVLVVLAACGGSGATGGGGGHSFKGTKKLGLTTAITGQSALYGKSISEAVKLAVDDLDARGGVNGYRIEPDIQDDGTLVDKAVANVKQLILQDNVVALVGPVTSGQCQAASPVARQNKVLIVAATCNSYQLTTEPDLVNPYYVSIVPNTYMEGTAAGNLAARLHPKRIFIVSPKYLFGISETNAFVAALKKAGGLGAEVATNPQNTWYVPFPTNPRWDSTINQIQAFKPDLVYSNIFASDQVNFITQALQVDPQFFQKYPMTTLASVDELKGLGARYPAGLHLYMRAPFFALSNPRMNDFVSRYKARYGEYPSDWAVMNYDAVMVWAQAAGAAGTFDSEKVRARIVGHSFQSLRGYSFKVRSGDQQADVGETVGVTADSGGKYPFAILKDSSNLKGSGLIMPTNLVGELRDGKCEKGGDPKTADFALCPSWKV